MKKVLAFVLGMAATVAAIKLATKATDKYDEWEDDEMFFFDYGAFGRKEPTRPVESAKQKAERERKQARKALLAEQDYELASLYDAVLTHNVSEQERSKKRLAEINSELEALK